jgi:serine/threonine-protein kinase
VDRKGIEELTPLPPHFYRFPRISPDGKRVVLDIDEGNNSDIWLFDLLRGTLTRRTFDGTNLFAAWTPDGKRIAFQTTGNKAGQKGIAWATADGADTGELLAANDNNPGLGTWTPDGDTLIYHEFAPSRGRDIWTLSLKDGRRPRPLLQTAFNENNPVFAPDGRWIAYESDESGRYEIYVQPFPGQGGKILVSTEGGIQPVWSTDGHELFYRNGDKMMAVPITLQPNFHPSKPELLFEKPYMNAPFYPRSYDVAPDGRRFLMIKENDQVAAATVLNVVLNWFEELKQKLPVN